MKFIELAEDVEKALASICDSALKAGGLAIHHLVNQVTSAIKNKDGSPVVPPAAPVVPPAPPEPQG